MSNNQQSDLKFVNSNCIERKPNGDLISMRISETSLNKCARHNGGFKLTMFRRKNGKGTNGETHFIAEDTYQSQRRQPQGSENAPRSPRTDVDTSAI